MKTHSLIQGSPEWHQYRSSHWNASDAPAMMGCSPHKTRSQLLHEMATGQVPDIDASTQRRFDDGHRFEALARPLAEKIIGEDLYPVVGSEGMYSASFDGLTMTEDTGFEHKSLNDDLRACMRQQGGNANDFLPPLYRVQMEQQLMVSGAQRILFMATKWDGEELIEERHCWYTPDLELRARIHAGWIQFKADWAAYVPPEVIVPAVATPQLALPAVSINVTGSIALVDNLDKFGNALTAYVQRINQKPKTDQDFADLEATIKTLKTAEDALDAAEAGALAQTDSIDAMRKTVALYRETARTNRLLVEKLVKAEKENRRNAIVIDAAADLVIHINKLNERLGFKYMPHIASDFTGAVKGLKSIDSMKDKVATELVRAKIEANATADRIQANMQAIPAEHAALFPDLQHIVAKAADDFTALVKSRIADHLQREEARREEIRQEEADKLAKAQAAAQVPVSAPGPAAASITHAQTVQQMPPAVRQAMAPKPTSTPTLALGEISSRLGFNVTSAFLATLGFEATTVRAAKLYHDEDFKPICEAIKTHISEVQDQFEAVAA